MVKKKSHSAGVKETLDITDGLYVQMVASLGGNAVRADRYSREQTPFRYASGAYDAIG